VRFFGEEAKLVITSGDRSDMIVAALETRAAAVLLTNNIIPPANLVSMASEMKIPLLLVKDDTFATAKQIDDMEPLTTQSDEHRAGILEQLIRENVRIVDL
jgi:BioD-like phosphotransacetylase family protein